MCLASIIENLEPTDIICRGWKVFHTPLFHDSKPHWFFYRPNGEKVDYNLMPVELDVWMKANQRPVIKYPDQWGEGFDYISGFHIYKNKPIVSAPFAAYEVEYKQARILGTDNTFSNGMQCIIADEMRVL